MKQNISLKQLKKASSSAYDKNKDIVDILLFGSVRRGKSRPKDIDVLVLFNRNVDRSILRSYNPVSKTFEDFMNNFPTESLLTEGFSLIFDRSISELYKMESAYLFRYSLKGKTKSQRMIFYYALYGRNTRGLMATTQSRKFSSETILTPLKYAEHVKEFFSVHKVDYFSMPILFPSSYSNAEKLSVR